ncbi:hypothetical protein ACJVDH_16365 [Pedobacter sp. AW1-32]|uniref:hypothetical protein n=1 Tax=Pedobacter sp. AW1-32 TaxID=3383026 RepID=UPI003FEDF154
MENTDQENKNLGNEKADNAADRSNLPENQVPRHRSNDNEKKNEVKSDAGYLGRNFGKGDFGSEEAREDADKGNKGHAGNMPNSESK